MAYPIFPPMDCIKQADSQAADSLLAVIPIASHSSLQWLLGATSIHPLKLAFGLSAPELLLQSSSQTSDTLRGTRFQGCLQSTLPSNPNTPQVTLRLLEQSHCSSGHQALLSAEDKLSMPYPRFLAQLLKLEVPIYLDSTIPTLKFMWPVP